MYRRCLCLVRIPEQFSANILRAFELGGEIVRKMVEDKDKRDGAFTVMGGLADAPKLFAPIAQYWMSEPREISRRRKPS